MHLLFSIELYKIQLRGGRYFVHEHPWPAWSWQLPAMTELMKWPGVRLGKGNMCRHGMMIDTPEGRQLALKATGFLTNLKYILESLAKTCTNNGGPNDHKHASLQQSRSAHAAIYLEKLCFAILRGLRKQLTHDSVMNVGEIGSVSEDPIEKKFLSL